VDIEWGENRQIWGIEKDIVICQNDRYFRRTQPRWKGAGVAVPVFSLRTEESFGIGEFQDLKKMADWAVATGQKMIQTLPINDTTLRHNDLDSYPYNAVSVFTTLKRRSSKYCSNRTRMRFSVARSTRLSLRKTANGWSRMRSF
jgi:4-alpha-glucanotransferase